MLTETETPVIAMSEAGDPAVAHAAGAAGQPGPGAARVRLSGWLLGDDLRHGLRGRDRRRRPVFDNAGPASLIVDENSAYYLQGAQIDYEDSLMGGGFRIFNPNAVRSCGCGHSFDTGEDAGYARACGCGGH